MEKLTKYYVEGIKVAEGFGRISTVTVSTPDNLRLFVVGGTAVLSEDIFHESGTYLSGTSALIAELGNPLAMLGVEPRFIGVSFDGTNKAKVWLRASEVTSEQPPEHSAEETNKKAISSAFDSPLLVYPPAGSKPC